MVNQTTYTVNTTEGTVELTITPENSLLPNGDYYATGVYRLTSGTVGMGEIVFDENRIDWDYNGMDGLTWEEPLKLLLLLKTTKTLPVQTLICFNHHINCIFNNNNFENKQHLLD